MIDFGSADSANDILLVQPDGKIVVVGSGASASANFAMARLGSNGSLDTGFSGDGKLDATFGVPPGGNADVARSVVLLPNGKLVVAGFSDAVWGMGSYDFAVLRLTSAGLLDSGFADGGKLLLDFGDSDQAFGVALDPALPAAVEELARFDFPTKFVTRYTLEPIEVGEQRIDAGELVFGALGSANRDPRVFPDPDRLDLSRVPGPTLTFGAGAHFCLGASLARAEAAEMIGQLVGRFPDLELVGEPSFAPHFNIRLMTRLPVRLGEARPSPGRA